MTTREYLEVTLGYDRGKLLQRSLRKRRFSKPRKIKRIVGRFLARLYAGKQLVDVVPFNFPLLAPAENFTPTGRRIAQRMEANLRTAVRIRLPYLSRINRIEIRDIGTRRHWALDLSPLRPRPAARPKP
ncbi:MAG: hypothetical protein ABI333_17460 [bacterium]